MVVKETSVGKGLFSIGKIKKGNYICEIKGEITQDMDPEYNYYIDYLEDSVMDPFPPYRYINHSCEPNCQFIIEESNENGVKEKTVYLEAIEDISPGEEFCTDYAWEAGNDIPCKCGKKSCRGWIVAKEELVAASI